MDIFMMTHIKPVLLSSLLKNNHLGFDTVPRPNKPEAAE